MDRLLRFLLETFIRRGTFRVTTSRGTVFTFGDGTGTPVAVRFATRAAEWGILLDPELKFGEAYMNGTFVVEQGTIADVLAICLGQKSEVPHWARPQFLLRYLKRRLSQFNPRRRARNNVAHHYDLDGRLYSLFLDADIAAATLRTSSYRSTTPNSPRNGTSPPSSCSSPTSACSTSAAAGVDWACILPKPPAPMSPG